jgi:flagellar protein FlaF
MSMETGYAAYIKRHVSGLTGRAVEAEALLKAARLLVAAEARPGDMDALATALDFNFRLWTVLEADLAHEHHPLPVAIRGDLMSLCQFMEREIAKAAHHPEETDLKAMIEVNRTLAAGLL